MGGLAKIRHLLNFSCDQNKVLIGSCYMKSRYACKVCVIKRYVIMGSSDTVVLIPELLMIKQSNEMI